MAKQLFPECDDLVIKTIQISRKPAGEDESGWQTYMVVIGEAVSSDGTMLKKIHEKILIGGLETDPWDMDSIEDDLKTISGLIKGMTKAMEDEHTKKKE